MRGSSGLVFGHDGSGWGGGRVRLGQSLFQVPGDGAVGVWDGLAEFCDFVFGSIGEEEGDIAQRLCSAKPGGYHPTVAGQAGEVNHNNVGRVHADGPVEFRGIAATIVFRGGTGAAESFEKGLGLGWFPVNNSHAHGCIENNRTMRRVLVLSLLLAALMPAQVVLKQGDGKLSVSIEGKPFGELLYGPETRKPYFHPMRSASGKQVTRSYPMISEAEGKALGEAVDHPHHQGLSFTYAEVNGYNYWASDKTQIDAKSGRIRLKRVVSVKGATARYEFEWLDPKGVPILLEDRTMTFGGTPTDRTVDFDFRFKALTQVVFSDTKEGMFNMRVAPSLEEPQAKGPKEPKRTGVLTSSAGCRTEKECWGKRAAWMDVSGEVEGEKLGIAIFDHPGNPKHPTYWHARGYGLFAANPFGARDYTGDKTQDGSMTLKQGEGMRFRYRVLIHPDGVGLEEAYRKWSGR